MRGFERFTRLPAGDGWFDVYEIRSNLFAIHEPGHCEEPTSCLLLGEQRAALIDTGCGIGNLRGVVDALTDLPVLVVNTHTRTSIIWAATHSSITLPCLITLARTRSRSAVSDASSARPRFLLLT